MADRRMSGRLGIASSSGVSLTSPEQNRVRLAIPRSIVQPSGGPPEAENTPEAGVTCSFTLPIENEAQ